MADMIEVLPLEWVEHRPDCWRARGIKWVYEIIAVSEVRFCLTYGPRLRMHQTLEAAKGMAQADQAECIMPYVAITPAPSPDVARMVDAGNQMRKRCGPRAHDGNEWDAALAALEARHE